MPMQLEAIADRSWDAVVVGGGPAGAMAARELARRGRAVLLVDKSRFPRYKVCGCCLNARALSALDTVGLGDLVRRLNGVPLHTLAVGRRGHRLSVRLPQGMAVSREAFDAALLDAAREAGAAVLTETTAFVCSPGKDSRNVRLRRNNAVLETTARLVVAADGLGGRLLREQGFDSPAEEESRVGAGVIADAAPGTYDPGIIHMACAPGGYVGLVRIEDGRLNIAAAFELDFMKAAGGMGSAAAAVLESAGFPPVPDLRALSWRGTPALTRRATLVSAPRGFVLGDAAGYVEPFTGEGMAWALTSAIALAPIAERAIQHYNSDIEREWAQAYDRVVRRRQYVCRFLAAGLRRQPLVAATTAVVAAIPAVAQPFVKHINVPLGKEGLTAL